MDLFLKTEGYGSRDIFRVHLEPFTTELNCSLLKIQTLPFLSLRYLSPIKVPLARLESIIVLYLGMSLPLDACAFKQSLIALLSPSHLCVSPSNPEFAATLI